MANKPNVQDTYTGPERRVCQKTLKEISDTFQQLLVEHELRETERIKHLVDLLALEAFPDGAHSHRESHQAMIDAAKAEKKFWDDLRGDVLKKSIWGVLQILMTLIGLGLAAKFGISVIGGK